MTKSQSTTETIGLLESAIESDLQRYEAGERDGFAFLTFAVEVGMVVPFNWLDPHPEWQDKFAQFMSGSTVCHAGIYVRDVQRFLGVLKRDNPG